MPSTAPTVARLRGKVLELQERLKLLQDRLKQVSASVYQNQHVTTLPQNEEAYRQGTLRNLARQLGEEILNSPFCTLNKRLDDQGQLITTVSVTLFKPGKKGTVAGGN